MKKLLLILTATVGFASLGPVARAQFYNREVVVEHGGPRRNLNDGYDRYYNHRRHKTVYIIEQGRPVRREVFFDGQGRYYQIVDDRPVFIRERVFESYPARYYYRDGRRRPGIVINF